MDTTRGKELFTAGPWRKVTGKTYCAVRSDERVIADMRIVGLYYNTFDASLMSCALEMYAFIESTASILPEKEKGEAENLLKKARGGQ